MKEYSSVSFEEQRIPHPTRCYDGNYKDKSEGASTHLVDGKVTVTRTPCRSGRFSMEIVPW